jgi:hypothetical protein
MSHRLVITALFVGLFIPFSVVTAHHGNAAFATGKKLTVKGTVTEWTWGNPHIYLKLDVRDEKGNVVHWIAEASNPAAMRKLGGDAGNAAGER